MTGTQWKRVRELFEEMVDQVPSDVQGWLAVRCDDGEVRKEVASLLMNHSHAGEFLTHPAGDLSELLDEPAGLMPAQEIGPYRVEREIGRGGMGRVYRAIDTRLNRAVALKALPSDVAPNPSQRERLRREARAAAALSHPGICTVHALEELDGDLYIVTELIEGTTLRDEIGRTLAPAPDVAVDTARQLASALASAHAIGITHRDLKPENVMRTTDGRIKVLDFGLARVDHPVGLGAAPLVTQPGALLGTLAYMSPEQLNGSPADARTDVFAFGVLMYEFTTGEHPFNAPTAIARAARVLEASPDPLARRRPDLPAALAAVVDRCLRKLPSERFASAAEIVIALGPLRSDTADLPVTKPAGVPAAPPRDTSWWRTHQLVMIAVYFTASVLAWLVKEWRPGATSAVFIALGIATTIVGVLRAHLLFTERTHGGGLDDERRRVEPVTLALDLLIAAALAADGLAIAPSREVAGVLILGLAVGLALARLVLEPATTRAAFGEVRSEK